MYWGIPTAIPLIALVCYGTLLLITAMQGLERKVNRFFALYLMSILIWSFGAFMMYIDAQNAVFWNKVLLGGVVGMPLTVFGFVRAFLLVEGQAWWLYWGYISSIVLLVINARGYLAEHVHLTEEGLIQYQFGPAVPLYGVYFVLLLGLSALNLIRGYRQRKDYLERNRIRYALLGITAIVLGGTTNLLPVLKFYPTDVVANIINALLIAYAIFRYQLLDITVVVRKGLLYSIPTAIIGASYFLVIFLAVNLFHIATGYQVLLLSLAMAAVTAVAIRPLWDMAQLWVDRLFFREKYDSSLMLQRLSRTAASVLDLDRLTSMILDEVTITIHIERAAFFLRQEESGGFHLMAQKGLDQNASSRLRRDHPIVDWLSSHENALTRHDVDVMPKFKALWGQEREDLEKMRVELFIPLKAKDELVGILAVGPKLSEETYSQDDQLTLSTLANQAAVAIENARLYDVAQRELAEREQAEEALKEYSERLEEMVEQRTHELQKAYSDLRDSQAKLIQSEKLAATGRLAVSVAHEINNPLQGISNYLSLISQQVTQDNPLHEDLDMVKLGFERIAEIVRRLRAFHRPAGEKMEPTDINGVVKRALALVSHQLSLGKVEVKPELAEQELLVLGSAGQLEQVLLNLVLNAQEAMPEGGGLLVRTMSSDDVVQLQVSDTGLGIGEEEMGRLFKPFYGGSGGTGLGLGLWISHNIIEGHGGRIEVESQVGEGTTFTISLPAYQ